jgi:hypothetical protein
MPVLGYLTSIHCGGCGAGPFGALFCMVRPVTVEPLRGYRLRLRYAVGVEGIIDLSWSDDLDICPDSAYLEITGKD